MSIFQSIFGGSTGGIAHSAAGATPLPATPAAAAPAVADPAATATTEQAASSPLDTFKAFWDTPKNADGTAIQPPADPTQQNIYNFDPATVSASAKKLDFTAGMNPELATRALGGDATALMEMMNHVTQTAFTAATVQTGKLINESHVTNNQRLNQTLPTQIKKVQLSQTETVNPVLQHPAAQPLVEALKASAFARNPNANPGDVTRSVEQLLVGLGVAMAEATPASQAAKTAATAGETDWSTF